MNRRQHGKWGEDIALEYLEKKGYITLARSFYSRFGEIDLVMRTKEYLVFIEVKTRKDKRIAHAREFVSLTKQRKIISAAKYWLMKKPTSLQPRFDVIEVYAKDGVKTEKPEIIHIENAFGV
ncbi:MAG: YraN family protein [Oscillospiraceae bacterium]|jgi:putative endonuclease|nr:YraN family protein [Oscillospiraceae bacterium]